MNLAALFTGLGDDPVKHCVPAPFLDFGHRVKTHALFAHPLERRLTGAARTQADLDVVGGPDVALVNQAIHRRAVTDQVRAAPPGVIVRVKMNDRHLLLAVNVGQRGHVRVLE